MFRSSKFLSLVLYFNSISENNLFGNASFISTASRFSMYCILVSIRAIAHPLLIKQEPDTAGARSRITCARALRMRASCASTRSITTCQVASPHCQSVSLHRRDFTRFPCAPAMHSLVYRRHSLSSKVFKRWVAYKVAGLCTCENGAIALSPIKAIPRAEFGINSHNMNEWIQTNINN